MAALDVSIRRPMRYQRPKSNDLGVKARPTTRAPVDPSKQKEPFDPAELSRRLELYRQDLKLARARRELAEQKSQGRAALERNDSGNTIQEEQERGDEEEAGTVEQGQGQEQKDDKTKAVASKRPAAERRPSSIRPRTGPRRKSVSGPRVKPRKDYVDPSAPYVPRFAARQFASTTTPIRAEGQDSRRISTAHKYDWDKCSPRSAGENESDDLDTTFRDRRRNTFAIMLEQASAQPTRSLPLSATMATLHLHDQHDQHDSDSENNPYILTAHKAGGGGLHHDSHHDSHDSCDGAGPPRPSLKQSAKHDWSQASQCGDSARHSLHLFSSAGKRDRAGEYAEVADLHRPTAKGASANGGHLQQPAHRGKPRQRSHGDMPDNMVSEAVDRIKSERRRSSILGLFKRH